MSERTCGGCTMCCKLLGIEEINKPTNKWCEHCDIGKGCKIYDNRPEACQTFKCYWLMETALPDDIRPDRTGVVMFWPNTNNTLQVHVDPAKAHNINPETLTGKILTKIAGMGIDILVTIGSKRKAITYEGSDLIKNLHNIEKRTK